MTQLQEMIDALNEGLRPEAVEFMSDVSRAGMHENRWIIPIARRVLNDHDTIHTPEVFILSLQAHFNLWFEDAFEIISKNVHGDPEADTCAWLCVHYILTHASELKRAT